MSDEENTRNENLRKQLFQEKITRLENLGFKVEKTGDDGVTFFVRGRMSVGVARNADALKRFHLGNEEWNIMDHLLYVLQDQRNKAAEQAIQAAIIRDQTDTVPKNVETPSRADKRYDLKSLHTRVLKIYLDKARKCGGYYDPGWSGYGTMRPIYIDQIKAELATRPHIPRAKDRADAHTKRNKMKKDRGGRGRR